MHQVRLRSVSLFSKAILFACLTVLIRINIASTLVDNVVSPFTCFIDFANSLAFFLFKEADTVAQQFEVFFSTLASHFRGNEFFVQRRIIIFFVGGEVHLVVAVGGLGTFKRLLMFLIIHLL